MTLGKHLLFGGGIFQLKGKTLELTERITSLGEKDLLVKSRMIMDLIVERQMIDNVKKRAPEVKKKFIDAGHEIHGIAMFFSLTCGCTVSSSVPGGCGRFKRLIPYLALTSSDVAGISVSVCSSRHNKRSRRK